MSAFRPHLGQSLHLFWELVGAKMLQKVTNKHAQHREGPRDALQGPPVAIKTLPRTAPGAPPRPGAPYRHRSFLKAAGLGQSVNLNTFYNENVSF